MSRVLANLLGKAEEEVRNLTSGLESLSGYLSEDVRLIAEVKQAVRQKTADLGLDPDDTTGEELYHALRVKAQVDCQQFFDSHDSQSFETLTKSIYKSSDIPKEVWSLKHSVAKKMLGQYPPKRLMKELHYRSVDSMLKRENICFLLGLIEQVESATYQNNFWKAVKNLQPGDFSLQSIELFIAKPVDQKFKNAVTINFLSGSLFVWYEKAPREAASLLAAMHLFEATDRLHGWSLALGMHRFRTDFAGFLAKADTGRTPEITLRDHKISWLSVHRYFGDTLAGSVEPVSPSPKEAKLSSAIECLAQVDSQFNWWVEGQVLAAEQGVQPVSFNLMDILSDLSAKRSYHQRTSLYFRQVLATGLVERYLKYEGIQSRILEQLEDNTGPGDWQLEPVEVPVEAEFSEMKLT